MFEYDAVGNLTKTTDPRLKETRFGYDERNRKIWMDDPIGSDRNSRGHTLDWDYDAAGNKRFETRADDTRQEWRYDTMNRVTDTYGFANEHTHYDRNVTGTEESTTDAKNAVYAFHYDVLHRKTGETYPADASGVARAETWHYDAAGNMDEYHNPAGQTKHLSYDERNRARHSWWDGAAGPDVVTNVDPANRMTDITTNNGETVVAFGYDDANRQIWEDQTVSGHETHRVQHDRDQDGNAISNHVPVFFLVWLDYNQRGELAHIYDGNGTPWINYSYDAAGNMTQRRAVYGGINVSTNAPSQDYDGLNRPTYREQTRGGDIWFAGSHYQYDSVGREVATWRDEDGSKGERFTYNADNQLTSAIYGADNVSTGNATNPTSWRSYNYGLGLLELGLGVNDNGYVAPFTNDALNQYFSINGGGISYDDKFNLISFGGVSYTYDAANRLVSGGGAGGSMQCVYGGLGRCVKRTLNGAAVVYVYDGWKPIFEHAWDNAWFAWNMYGAGADEILWRYDSRVGHLRYHSDIHGNVTALLDWSGNIIEKYTYDAFGQPRITNGDGTGARNYSNYWNRFLFTGREWIGELNVYDYRNRYYRPDIGRFLQTDPMGLQTEGEKLTAGQKALFSPGGTAPEAFGSSELNLYGYCHNDPVNHSDPTGLITLIISGYGPGQSENSETKWSNQQFIQYAKATDPHNYAVFGRAWTLDLTVTIL